MARKFLLLLALNRSFQNVLRIVAVMFFALPPNESKSSSNSNVFRRRLPADLSSASFKFSYASKSAGWSGAQSLHVSAVIVVNISRCSNPESPFMELKESAKIASYGQ